MEQVVFELLDTLTTPQIAAAIGMTVEEALPIIPRVIDERGTPSLAAVRKAIDDLASIHFV